MPWRPLSLRHSSRQPESGQVEPKGKARTRKPATEQDIGTVKGTVPASAVRYVAAGRKANGAGPLPASAGRRRRSVSIRFDPGSHVGATGTQRAAPCRGRGGTTGSRTSDQERSACLSDRAARICDSQAAQQKSNEQRDTCGAVGRHGVWEAHVISKLQRVSGPETT